MCGGGSNAELADKDEGGQGEGVCYGGICTVGVVVRAGKGGRAGVYEKLSTLAACPQANKAAEGGVTGAMPQQ